MPSDNLSYIIELAEHWVHLQNNAHILSSAYAESAENEDFDGPET